MEPYYIQIVTEKPVERFLQKLLLSNDAVQNLVIVSPWIGSLHQSYFCIENLCKKILREEIPTYVITRAPEDKYHQEAVDIFLKTNFVEVRFNQSIHAKLYVCICQDMHNSFALFGSGNLTWASLNRNIEIGMMIFGYGPGRELIQELYYWGSVRLRTQKDSKLIKKIHR